jgi:putative ABC transport system substrate-binding protein
MRRRDLLVLLGGVVISWSGAARTQQRSMPVVGLLSSFSRGEGPLGRGPIAQGLGEAGYVYGQNVTIEYRWAEGAYDRLPVLAADLVSRKVDIIVTIGGTPAALAARNATSTIPIVFTSVSDPVGVGLATSLARPGGNLTGFSNIAIDLMAKLLEVLSELVPQAGVIVLLVNPNSAYAEREIRDVQEAARAKRVKLAVLKAGTEGEIDAAFASLVELQAGGLVVEPDFFFDSRRAQIVALATRHAVPAIAVHAQFVAAGGLISYGTDDTAVLRQAGIYAGRILKGAKPADLPVQQPTTFELVVNLKTAKALGLTIPPTILARADEVIE